MIKHNTYFDNQVQSLGFEDATGPATIGVMAPGRYDFGTSTREVMTVVSGKLAIRHPGAGSDTEYGPGESFEVASGVTFGVRVEEPTSYLCRYGD